MNTLSFFGLAFEEKARGGSQGPACTLSLASATV